MHYVSTTRLVVVEAESSYLTVTYTDEGPCGAADPAARV